MIAPEASRAGRPLRFLALTIGGWASARAVLLWPSVAVPPVPILSSPAMAMPASALGPTRWPAPATDQPAIVRWPARTETAPPRAAHRSSSRGDGDAGGFGAIALAALVGYGEATVSGPFRATFGAIPPPLRPTPLARGRSRLAGSAWLIARGGADGTLTGGQLGASQTGARLTYALGEARRVALSARIASPLGGRGKEAAFGFDWQPTRRPLHLVAEQRVALDGGRGGPTVMLVGGIDPTPVLAGFRLEGYAQAGAIKRDAVEAFGDGAARLTHPLGTIGPVRLDVGAGAWGAAQRGARRLDVGPTIGMVAPVAGKALRVALDWRARVAGSARPGSGPALSIGTDF